jgi:hypothetical protein
VTCTLTNSPSESPSRVPTRDPAVHSEPDTSRGSITGIAGVPQTILSSIPTSKVTTPPPAFDVFLPQENSLQETDLLSSIDDDFTSNRTSMVTTSLPENPPDESNLPSSHNDESEEDLDSFLCPDNFSGARPSNQCSEYYYCLSGKPNLPSIKCAPGTVFLEPMSFDVMISCAPIEESSQECSIGPVPDDFVADSSESSESNTSQAAMANETEEPNSTDTQGNVNEEPVLDSDQNRSPCKACPAHYTGYHASTTDCVTYCLCEDGVLSRVLYACPSDWLFDDEQGRCLPSDQATCSSDALDSLEQDEEIIYVPLDNGSSAPAKGEENDVEEEDQNQKHKPPSFSFDVPFLTIEIKLSGEQSGIGWAVLSSDGSLNIAKPPGDYKDYKPSTTGEISPLLHHRLFFQQSF